jgi:hypothetical protein
MASVLKVDKLLKSNGTKNNIIDLELQSSGMIIKTHTQTDSTRVVYNTTPIPFFNNVSFTKVYDSATSYLLVTALCMSKKLWSYANDWYVTAGGVTVFGVGGWNDTANSGTNSDSFTRGTTVIARVNGVASGAITVGVFMRNASGGALALTVNPNSADDSRYSQQMSTLLIQEIVI